MLNFFKNKFDFILNFVETLRNSYWFIPAVMLICSLILSFQMLEIDKKVIEVLGEYLPWFIMVDSKGMADVLSVIAGSIMTVTGVVFSITMVTLTLASSQFGPRLLRNFLRDRIAQVTFGSFLATFLYCVMILSTVKDDSIPQGASLFAIFLVLINMFILIYFIHHTAVSIQVSSIINEVAKEYKDIFLSLYKNELKDNRSKYEIGELKEKFKYIDKNSKTIQSNQEGYIRVINYNQLLKYLSKYDTRMKLLKIAGDYVYEKDDLGIITPAGHINKEIMKKIHNDCFIIGSHRTPIQDLRYLIGQLTEIALRALSPGINDPLTAVECIQKYGNFVILALEYDLTSTHYFDNQEKFRIEAKGISYESILHECFDPIRVYGSEHIKIVETVLNTLGTVKKYVKNESQKIIIDEYINEVYKDFKKSVNHENMDTNFIKKIYHNIK